jgi:hypothetical protein
MGFDDEEYNLAILIQTNGNVNHTMEIILSQEGDK